MAQPLIYLLRLQARALLRRLTRGLWTIKGIFLFLFGLGVMFMWLAPSFLAVRISPPSDPENVRTIFPLSLLVICILNVISAGGEKAIAFTPAEVDFLFPAPFTRRQLLTFKIAKSLLGIAFSSLIMSVAFLRHSAGWGQAFIAAFLTLIFMQLFSMSIALISQSAGERAYTRARKLALIAIAAALVIALLPALREGGQKGMLELARSLRQSPVGSVLLAPLSVYARVFTARQWFPELAMYAGIAIAINLALLWIVFWLDADYLEASAARSAAFHDRIQRLRQGGIMASGKFKARGSLPRPPRWGGIGPILWRQASTAIRSSRGMLIMIVILGFAAIPVMLGARHEEDPTAPAVSGIAFFSLMMTSWLRFDFRAELDRMDYLKSLPIAPYAMAAGQIATPALFLMLADELILGGIMIVKHQATLGTLMAAVLCIPFSILIVGIENLIFLNFPVRVAAGPGDFQGFGRQMLMLVAKMLLILLAAGLTLVAGLVIHALTGSWVATGAAALIVLGSLATGVVFWAGAAFRRFDVVVGVPE